jgi:RNA polymerase sigma-70 factor (ECF subfamily)
MTIRDWTPARVRGDVPAARREPFSPNAVFVSVKAMRAAATVTASILEWKQMSRPTDEQLMCQVRDGQLSRLGELFERYHVSLFHFFQRLSGNRQFSEDLVQEVFLRILRFRHTFRDDSAFPTWMYQIARNARVDALRRQHNESALNEEFDQRSDEAPHAESRAMARQQEALLRAALARLGEEQRELLVLSRYQDLKYHQIAELLDCEPGTVKTRVFRAMAELRRIFFDLTGAPARPEA